MDSNVVTCVFLCTTVGIWHDTQGRAVELLYATSKWYEDRAKNSTFYSRDLNDLITTCMFFHYENALMEACWVKVRGVLATNLGIHCARAMWTWWLPFPLHLLSTCPGTLYGYLNWSFKSLEWKVGFSVPRVLRSNAACSNSFIRSTLLSSMTFEMQQAKLISS